MHYQCHPRNDNEIAKSQCNTCYANLHLVVVAAARVAASSRALFSLSERFAFQRIPPPTAALIHVTVSGANKIKSRLCFSSSRAITVRITRQVSSQCLYIARQSAITIISLRSREEAAEQKSLPLISRYCRPYSGPVASSTTANYGGRSHNSRQ
jgi:hypothetical protein